MIAVVNSMDKMEQKVKNVFRVIMMQTSMTSYTPVALLYAKAGLELSGEALKVQIGYVLNNLQYWRGDEARKCKKVLKEFVK